MGINYQKGRIIIISGPSGVGKGTIIRELSKKMMIHLSVSATTRLPRAGEINGDDYFFLSPVDFEEKIRSQGFLEWAQVHGHYYGTLKSEVNRLLSQGEDILLEIDVQGARIVMESDYPVVSIFLVPPSMDTLKERLVKRSTDSIENIEKRLKRAEVEMFEQSHYTRVVRNDTVEQSVHQVKLIIENREIK